MLQKSRLLSIEVTIEPKEGVLQTVNNILLQGNMKTTEKVVIILTPNPEQVMFARTHDYFYDFFSRATFNLPDGVGITAGLQILSGRKVKRVPGVEFMTSLVELADAQGYTIGFIGGQQSSAMHTLEVLSKSFSKINGWSDNSGEWLIDDERLLLSDSRFTNQDVREKITNEYFRKLAMKIVKTKTRMVFVGLGVPKQELFIFRLKEELLNEGITLPIVLMAVGGSFEILSGQIPRAPGMIRSWGLEWLWRLLQEPWRIKRQTSLIGFMFLVFNEFLKKKRVG